MRTVVLLSLAFSVSLAIDIGYFAPYGIPLDDQLDIGDDIVSDSIPLRVPIVFYGQQQNQIYVSTNGLITFDQPIAEYKGDLFPLSGNRAGETVQAIAPFYADVDTYVTGTVFYRETNDTTVLEQQSLLINKVFNLPSDGQFEPTSVFIVTWSTVGSYRRQGETNTIQLIIATDGSDSYALFLYVEGGFKWVDAVDTKPGVAALSAQAGFDSGSQGYPSFVLPDSGLPEAIDWVKTSNTFLPGLWAFKIGSQQIIEEPPVQAEGDGDETDDTTDGCGGQMCHPDASCVNSCCQCNAGYFGNGIGCLKAGEQIYRMSGDVMGRVNENSVDEALIQVSVVVDGTRMYTALSRLPPLAGYPLQLAVPIGELIGWLYAGGDGPNGFDFTGGVLNYTATLSAAGEQLKISLSMNGASPFTVELTGSIPTNLQGKQAKFSQHTTDYAKSQPGVYRSRSARVYTVDELELVFNIEEVIEFVECGDKAPATYRVTHSDYFVQYNENSLNTQYSMISNTEESGGSVCAVHDCHFNAECVPRGNLFSCICKLGYEGNGRECTDVNECDSNIDTCHAYATCYNTDGGYICQCGTGFSGDGFFCGIAENRQSCRDLNCHEKATCDYRGDRPYCSCNTGFSGDGFILCDPIVTTCREVPEICNANAACIYNPLAGRYECQCMDGFSGDGEVCDTPVDASCAFCSYYADCVENVRGYFHCVCRAGFTGDGASCDVLEVQEVTTVPPSKPAFTDVTPSVSETTTNIVGTTPVVIEPSPVATSPTVNYATVEENNRATELLKTPTKTSTPPAETSTPPAETSTPPAEISTPPAEISTPPAEVSTPPAETSTPPAHTSTPPVEVLTSNSVAETTTVAVPDRTTTSMLLDRNDCRSNVRLCDANARCAPGEGASYKCICNDGYYGPGTRCVEADCTSHADCGEERLCRYSRELNKYECYTQQPEVKTCSEVSICADDATCNDTPEGPQCACLQGYQGDGFSCTKIPETCATRPSLCDRNAVCSSDQTCICNPGFRGDGTTCTPSETAANFLLFSRGQSVFRVPFYQAGVDRGQRVLYRHRETIVGLAFDCANRDIYFSDINSGTISRTSLENTTNSEIIATGLSSPEGLAVDWVSRLLFVTDSEHDTIEAISLDPVFVSTEEGVSSGQEVYRRKVIINTNLTNPRAIAVDPTGSRIFWSDWGREIPKIESSNMDGSDRRILVDSGLGLPNGLIYNAYRRELCWADAGTRQIECVNAQGGDRRVVFDYPSYPFSLTEYRDNFYWTDWNIASIQTIPMGGSLLGTSIAFPPGGRGKPYSITVAASQCAPAVNRCSQNPEYCGGKLMCLPAGSRALCECPDNIHEEECNELAARQ